MRLEDVADDAQVVGDEQVGQPHLALQLQQQVDDLRLDGDVQRRHRLVGDDQLRLQGQRPRDADALPLAARELVRIAAGGVPGHADHVQQLPGEVAEPPPHR